MKYNCKKANEIPMKEILEKFKVEFHKKHKDGYWYFSPFREEKTASFLVNIEKNVFYDFGLAYGGNNIDLVRKLMNCSIKEALQFFNENFDIFSFNPQPNPQNRNTNFESEESIIEIISIVPISHPALLEYLKYRGISFSKVHEFIHQINYKVNDKYYFSIAMKNDKNGFELKNKFIGNSTSPKFLTSIFRDNKNLIITEAMFDFLSWIELNFDKKNEYDFIILHSTIFAKEAIKMIKNYNKIELYLDNDEAGKRATNLIQNSISNAYNQANTYSEFKDLNEFLIAEKSIHNKNYRKYGR